MGGGYHARPADGRAGSSAEVGAPDPIESRAFFGELPAVPGRKVVAKDVLVAIEQAAVAE